MFRTVFFIVVVGMISACASKPTYELDYDRDFDFSNFKTYRWYDDVVHSRESQYRKFNSSDKRIREVVSKELAVHNLRESKDEGADFWINYTVSKQRQQIIHSTGYDKGMHGGVSAGSYGNSVMVGYSSGPSVREYDEGTAILDVIDASTQKIVWRGIAEGRLKDHQTMSERYKATTAVASELLGDFHPGTAP